MSDDASKMTEQEEERLREIRQIKEIRGIRRLRRWCVGYVIGLGVLTVLFREVGEQAWWLVFWMFLPVGFWLLPMLVLVPLAWRRDRQMLGLLAVAWLWMMLGFAGWRPATSQQGEGGEQKARQLTLVTFNAGEDNGTSANAFLQQHRPDLFLMQSVAFGSGKSSSLKSVYPDKPGEPKGVYVKRLSWFTIESRYPVLEAELIREEGWHMPVAVRFRIDLEGELVTVYSVHLPTPRKAFMELSRKATPGNVSARERFGRFRQRLDDRVGVARRLLERMRSEAGPLIVAGDFNMPPWGWLYGEVAGQWCDVYGATGGGFGYTFPGYDPYFPTFYGVWLRLDYIFCNDAWKPLESEVERKRASQHRAVMARLELLP